MRDVPDLLISFARIVRGEDYTLFAWPQSTAEHGRDPIQLRHLQPLTRIADWGEQRKRWQTLLSNREPAPSR